MGSGISPLFLFDKEIVGAFQKDSKDFCLVGIDEAGRGPWAGPVVASAVALSSGFCDPGLNDSKKLTGEMRGKLYDKIRKSCRWGIGMSEVVTIDKINILQATYRAMENALKDLLRRNSSLIPGLVLIDGRPAPSFGFPQKSIVKGDAKSASIAAASVMAKVTRDRMMVSLDKIYPQYGFARHKGYGTPFHKKTLFCHGPSPVHRRSFFPVRIASKLSCA